MKWPIQLGMTITLAMLAPCAQALEFELTPFAAYRFGGQFEDATADERRDVEDSAAFGLAFDVEYSPGQAAELFYSRQSTSVEAADGPLELDVEYFQVGGVATYPASLDSDIELEPFVVGTIGAARFSPGSGLDDETRFAATLGGGAKIPLAENFALRLEARGYFAFFDSDTALFCISNETGATCRLRASGSVLWQIEAQLGFAWRF